jgi:hypothetical protein
MTIKILTIAQIVHIVQPSNHLWWKLHVVRYYIVCFVRASAFKEITTTSVIFSIIKNRENENNMTAEEKYFQSHDPYYPYLYRQSLVLVHRITITTVLFSKDGKDRKHGVVQSF